jgi:hypothetical protein
VLSNRVRDQATRQASTQPLRAAAVPGQGERLRRLHVNQIAMSALGVLALVASVGAPADAQRRRGARDGALRDGPFSWSERIPTGSWLRVHNVNGTIEVREAPGRTAEVRGEVLGDDRGDRDEVIFEVLQDGSSYTICAIWTENSTCDENGVSSRGSRRGGNVRVQFTVLLPSGVHLKAASGNGEVTVDNAGGDVVATSGNGRVHVTTAAGSVKATSGNGEVEVMDAGGPVTAHSGNGRIRVTTASGPVNASSGNGDIDVEMGTLRGGDDMTFRTGNGTVTVAVPRDFEGEVETSSGNGRFLTDFRVTVQGRLDASRFRCTIGRGGRRIHMSTGNGNLELRRVE